MRYIDFEKIRNLEITPRECVDWVREMFAHKSECQLPPKISIKMQNDIFVNTMPAYLPNQQVVGVKVVSRYPERMPALQSDILLYDAVSGQNMAFMDGTWITAMRTGAVAALSIQTLQKEGAHSYGFIGLGNTARATMLCLQAINENRELDIHLLRYKNHVELFTKRFEKYSNLKFKVFDTAEELIRNSDVVVSCVTAANELFAPDEAFASGILVVPVHTRGFQNCDLVFDKVFADDRAHVENFKYFNRFRRFDEISNVLNGLSAGRESNDEKILSYNIGIAIHDIYFASKVLERMELSAPVSDCSIEKYWV